MQDRYVGDIGDFGKYALLRAVTSASLGTAGRVTLAVNWHLVPDELGNNDGGHVAYLTPGSPQAYVGQCDKDLYESLRALVHRGTRSVAAVQESGILPADTQYYSVPLSFSGIRPPARREHRRLWLSDALDATSGADVVFLDPDNGLEVKIDRLSLKGPKYVFSSDIALYLGRSQSLMIYHHLCRTGSAADQIVRRLAALQEIVDRKVDLFALRYRRGTARVYFVIGQSEHKLRDRLNGFVRGVGNAHFDWIDAAANASGLEGSGRDCP